MHIIIIRYVEAVVQKLRCSYIRHICSEMSSLWNWILLLCGVLRLVASESEPPMSRLSFQRARRKFLSLIRRNPSKQPKLPDIDVDMLVPDGESAFYFGIFIRAFCHKKSFHNSCMTMCMVYVWCIGCFFHMTSFLHFVHDALILILWLYYVSSYCRWY